MGSEPAGKLELDKPRPCQHQKTKPKPNQIPAY